ncbi:MAG: amidohydrolase family protein [Candidatus Omnitrophota bacterium]
MTKSNRAAGPVLIFIASMFLFICAVSIFVAKESYSANWSDLRKGYIDTHIHLDCGRIPDVENRDEIKAKRYRLAGANLISQMSRVGVVKAIVMPPPQVVGYEISVGILDLSDGVRRFRKRLFLAEGGKVLNPLIHSYLKEDITPMILEAFDKRAQDLVDAGIVAFGELSILHLSFRDGHPFSEVAADHPMLLVLADVSARTGIPIDIHMEAVPNRMKTPDGLNRISIENPSFLHPNIEQFEALLSYNRDTKIVWQHIGWDNTGYMTVKLVRRLINTHPNLYIALRVEAPIRRKMGLPMYNMIVDGEGKIKKEWLDLFKEYPERFVIGSDEFIGVQGEERAHPQSFEETWAMIDQLPEHLAEKIGRANAARIYNL